MDGDDVAALGLLLFTLVLSLLAALTEAALVRTDQERVRSVAGQEPPSSPRLLRMLEGRYSPLSALVVWRLVLGGASLATLVFLLGHDARASWGPLAGTILGLLVFLGALPYVVSPLVWRGPDLIARVSASLVAPLVFAAGPAVDLVQKARRVLQSPANNALVGNHNGDASEPGILIRVDEPVNPPDEHELRMIEAILRMEDSTVREVMVPRVDLVAFSITEQVPEASRLMVESGHSRAPVYEEDIDHIVGVLHARDLLSLIGQEDSKVSLGDLLRPTLFVPETKRLDELLPEFLTQHIHIAMVVDEYGGTAGLVTLEDLLEEIVGEIVDEFSDQEPEVQVISQDEVLLDARVSLDYLHEHFDVMIDADGFDTVGGFVYDQLGKIPNPGDEVTAGGLMVQVMSTLGRRIKKVRVVKLPPTAAPDQAS